MKLLKHLLLAVTALSAFGAATAQTSRDNFVGPGVGITLSSVRNSADVSSTPGSDWAASSAGVGFVSSYGFEINKATVATFGFEYGLKNTDFGTDTSTGTAGTATAKNHWSVSFAPGLRVANDSLIYAKLAYHTMDVNYSQPSFSVTKTHSGTGLGIGYAIAVTPAIEFRTEYESITFDTQNTSATVTAKPKQQSLNFGLIAKF